MVMCIPVKSRGGVRWKLYVGGVYYGLFVSREAALKRTKPAW